MIDSHCHLDFEQYDGRRDQVVAEALAAGVHTIVNIGIDLPTSRRSVELAARYDSVYATVGVHPHEARTADRGVTAAIRDLAAANKVVAIGEIGLDFYRDHSPRDDQRRVFRQMLEMACQLHLPVVIHTREAFRETVQIVSDYRDSLSGGVFHCFPGDAADADRVIALGFVVGVGGVVTYKNSRMSRMVSQVPLESIILETDAPFLAPEPLRGKTNQPAYIKHICGKVAELTGRSPEDVSRITDRTCQKLYRLVETFGD